MKTLPDISQTLRNSLAQRDLTQAELKTAAGVSQRTLTNVLSGQEDFKVSTLMALADRLGLEMLLVPKGAANAVQGGSGSRVEEPAAPVVRSRVQAALERVVPSSPPPPPSPSPSLTTTPTPRQRHGR